MSRLLRNADLIKQFREEHPKKYMGDSLLMFLNWLDEKGYLTFEAE